MKYRVNFSADFSQGVYDLVKNKVGTFQNYSLFLKDDININDLLKKIEIIIIPWYNFFEFVLKVILSG